MANLFNLGHLPIPPFVADDPVDANRTALPDECAWGVLGGFKCIHDRKTGWDYAMAGNARVNDIYDSLVQEFRRTHRESGTAQQPEPSKPALSEVEQAAVNVVNAYHGCGDGAYDANSLPDAVFTLRDALRKRGAL